MSTSTVEPIVIDGSFGEGGGQILRSALALSGITGRPFVLENIRAGRKKPGLMRQHLTCVQAAAALCGAEVHGAALSSTTLRFWPGSLKAGRFQFSIGTAGSTGLVVQTVLPMAVWGTSAGDTVTVVDVDGGTHVPFAPVTDFLQRPFLAALGRLGVTASLVRERVGFYPAGGGRVSVRAERRSGHGVDRTAARPLLMERRGAITSMTVKSVATEQSAVYAQQCTGALKRLLRDRVASIAEAPQLNVEHEAVRAAGPGLAVWLEVVCEDSHELFSAIPERGDSATDVAARVAKDATAWLDADVPVFEHLADQLLLPMALAGGGTFLTTEPTLHSRTNALVIGRFLPEVQVTFEQERARAWRVVVR